MLTSLYSPFFTSGLLSQPITYPPSSIEGSLGLRRGSLPSDSPPHTSSREDSSYFYASLQPRRDENEYRSFLSLDLAESRSMRSASLKHFRFPRNSDPRPFVPALPAIPTVSPLQSHFSRDSLRSIPSPKPAPSMTLPPAPSTSPPRLPSIPVLPALELDMPTPSRVLINISRTCIIGPPPLPKRISCTTKATASSVSTRVRRHNRSEALAALEGRNRPIFTKLNSYHPTRWFAPSKPTTNRNFMIMSDDENEHEDEMADDEFDITPVTAPNFFFDPLFEPEDVVLPLSSQSYFDTPRSAPLPPSRSVPSKPPPTKRQRRHRKHPSKKRSNKDSSMLPSFIDLHDEDSSRSWNWRSFMEAS